jgi:Protein of unknown function (DUF2798)
MEGKAKFIFPILLTALVVFVVSCVVTYVNIGFRPDFVPRWLKAFIIGWPVAAIRAYVGNPHVRPLTNWIAESIEGKG